MTTTYTNKHMDAVEGKPLFEAMGYVNKLEIKDREEAEAWLIVQMTSLQETRTRAVYRRMADNEKMIRNLVEELGKGEFKETLTASELYMKKLNKAISHRGHFEVEYPNK